MSDSMTWRGKPLSTYPRKELMKICERLFVELVQARYEHARQLEILKGR